MIAAGQPAAGQSQTRTAELKVPREIAFLATHGVPERELAWAGKMAERTGVAPDAWLLKEEVVAEETFYRALAEHCGLPFLAVPQLGAGTEFPRSVETAVAPLANGRGYAIAPEGAQLRRLLELGDSRPDGLAIATPSAFRAAVLACCAPAIADRAAEDLGRLRPDDAFPRRDLAPALALPAAGLAALGLAAALVPQAVLQAVSLVLATAFLAMVLLRVFAVIHRAPVQAAPPERLRDSALPPYTVIVALYREARVVPQLVAALKRLDYPAAKLDIKLVLEQDDRETAAALAAQRLPASMQVIVAPPGLPRTKPRALNVALPFVRGAFTVVYDAEDEPDPGQLRLAVARFRSHPERVACLQARLAIRDPHNLLTRLFALEYAALFDVINPGLVAGRIPCRSAGPRTTSEPRCCASSSAGTPGTSPRTRISGSVWRAPAIRSRISPPPPSRRRRRT